MRKYEPQQPGNVNKGSEHLFDRAVYVLVLRAAPIPRLSDQVIGRKNHWPNCTSKQTVECEIFPYFMAKFPPKMLSSILCDKKRTCLSVSRLCRSCLRAEKLWNVAKIALNTRFCNWFFATENVAQLWSISVEILFQNREYGKSTGCSHCKHIWNSTTKVLIFFTCVWV